MAQNKTLSKKSWHFFIHRLMFGDNSLEPTNLCPYFWKSIVLGSLWCAIFLPISIPLFILQKIYCKISKDDDTPTLFESGLWSPYSFIAVLLDVALILLFCMISMWFISIDKDKDGNLDFGMVHTLGGVGWTIALVLLGCWIEEHYKKKRWVYSKRGKEKQPNIFVEMIKAWYKRNCPVIRWK